MDRLIVTIVPNSTVQFHDTWFTQWSSNTAWLAELPAAYAALSLGNSDPEPGTCTNQLWEEVESIDSFYHPDATFEMRSEETTNGHGHQACYAGDPSGVALLITSGVAAGSAENGAEKSQSDSKKFEIAGVTFPVQRITNNQCRRRMQCVSEILLTF